MCVTAFFGEIISSRMQVFLEKLPSKEHGMNQPKNTRRCLASWFSPRLSWLKFLWCVDCLLQAKRRTLDKPSILGLSLTCLFSPDYVITPISNLPR
jgi:hypothetical protein